MSQAAPRMDPYSVRGWCPSGTRPMQTGDGLIVRLSPRGRPLSGEQLTAIADLAERHGNGLVDLTRRANVQLRGLTEAGLPLLWPQLARIGLLDDGNASLLVSPLAGIDPEEIVDSALLAHELEGAVARNPALRALPPKFSFVVDGGGSLPLDDETADIRLRALTAEGHSRIAFAVDGPDGARYLGACRPEHAADIAANLAARFIDLRPRERARMRDLPDEAVHSLTSGMPMHATARPPNRPLGPVHIAGRVVAVGLAAAFGRLAATDLRALADHASEAGISQFRVSPWRSLYALTSSETAAQRLADCAAAAGFLTNPDDPLLAIDACPGAPACASASIDTRAVARALAPALGSLGIKSCHVSGCSKGCARSAPADLTLVGAGGSLAVVHRGTARSSPARFISPGDLATLPHLLDPA